MGPVSGSKITAATNKHNQYKYVKIDTIAVAYFIAATNN